MSKSLLSFVKVEFFEVGGGINESTNQKSSSCNPQFKVQTKLWKTKMIKKAPRRYLNDVQNFAKIVVDTLNPTRVMPYANEYFQNKQENFNFKSVEHLVLGETSKDRLVLE